jgi:hypothetical protein
MTIGTPQFFDKAAGSAFVVPRRCWHDTICHVGPECERRYVDGLGDRRARPVHILTCRCPRPIAGAGLLGLILASGGLLGWWRRKRKAPQREKDSAGAEAARQGKGPQGAS